MARLIWDEVGSRFYETGVSNGVLYPQDDKGEYSIGVPWNGLTNVSESPSGAEPNDLYADNIKYATMRSAETFGCTIEAYTYPDEFAECDGSKEVAPGVYVGQQARRTFGFSYKTAVGSDTLDDTSKYYKLHIVYGCTASPSEKSYATINDSPEAISFSWEITASQVNIPGFKPSATITLNSLEVDPELMKQIEDILYGTEQESPKLIMPEELIKMATEFVPTTPAGPGNGDGEDGVEDDETIEG